MSSDYGAKEECLKALKMFGDYWTLAIIYCLRDGGMRFVELQKEMGINPVTLTSRLKTLTRNKLLNRRKFTALTLLTFSHETTLAERTFVSAIGEPVDVLREPAEFEVRLLAAAPHARQLIAVRGRAQANSR